MNKPTPCVAQKDVRLLTIRISPGAMRELLCDSVLEWACRTGSKVDETTVEWDGDHGALVTIKIKLGDD